MNLKKPAALAVAVLLVACLAFIIYSRTKGAQDDAPPVKHDTAEPETQSATPSVESEPPEPEAPEPSATPEPEITDLPDIDINEWMYTLANTENLLSSDFAPEVTELEGGQLFDSRAVEALRSFIAAARAEGLSVYLTSSYRPYSTQQYLYNNKVNEKLATGLSQEEAAAAAARIVAYPGSSEHQLALAVDIVDKYYEYMNESLAATALSIWMKENCADYGFILRFPEDKQDVTGIMFEPWHFRYVGEVAARYIMDNGLCLEEFVELYR